MSWRETLLQQGTPVVPVRLELFMKRALAKMLPQLLGRMSADYGTQGRHSLRGNLAASPASITLLLVKVSFLRTVSVRFCYVTSKPNRGSIK